MKINKKLLSKLSKFDIFSKLYLKEKIFSHVAHNKTEKIIKIEPHIYIK